MTLPPMLEDPAFQEIVGEFVGALPGRMSQLQSAAKEGDWATALQLSHQLKGAGGSYGFDNVSLSAAKVEALCKKETTPEKLRLSMEQLEQECTAARCYWENR